MTPAELSVVADYLRERFDEATAARMLVADDLHRLLELACGEQGGQDCPYCGSSHGNGRDLSCTECGWYSVASRLLVRLAGSGPVGISYVSPGHVCEVRREDCWCAGLPGAGAG